MVGARIINQAFEEEFKSTKEKIVLLPTCMRRKSAADCKAQKDGLNMICSACSQECNINQINQIAQEEDFRVVMISHSSDFSKFLEKWQNQDEIELVEVACVLNLLLGGYEMKRVSIPVQCVLLDYCGCENH
ncbi:hypothetical protein U472_15455 [Orenia metallireducens]|uniref:DUF116 domain-containing protein n=1 Tax=Orenia metallireducens TaxID=1413210 RepID=A0A1C0A6E1_9FIRM|nr:hypothetical protein U472_15455 [Orenia metallireducens]